jgi:hypothetical protein
MGGFERICWKGTFVVAAAAAIDLIHLFFFTQASASQKADAAAQVGAIVIVTYVFTRAVQAWSHASARRRSRARPIPK